MKFKLHTYEIQDLMIAIISAETYDKSFNDVCGDKTERLKNLLTELNNMCSYENNYTLTVSVE